MWLTFFSEIDSGVDLLAYMLICSVKIGQCHSAAPNRITRASIRKWKWYLTLQTLRPVWNHQSICLISVIVSNYMFAAKIRFIYPRTVQKSELFSAESWQCKMVRLKIIDSFMQCTHRHLERHVISSRMSSASRYLSMHQYVQACP